MRSDDISFLKKALSFLDPAALAKFSKEREDNSSGTSVFMLALKQKNVEAQELIIRDTTLAPYQHELNQDAILVEFIIGIISAKEIISDQKIYYAEEDDNGNVVKSGYYRLATEYNKNLNKVISDSCVDSKTKVLLKNCDNIDDSKKVLRLSKLILDSRRDIFINELILRENIQFNSQDLLHYKNIAIEEARSSGRNNNDEQIPK